ncbi:hypothetical protein [Vibrio japonicus]|uniref:Uncharacterized protein n=1 Tax=Vibrio japonicus TaxID=1824638 RepID=A0ABY5LHQ2_9VIBR|nr:hypothetical protein [Vibrio japonicus]UUM30424.1 hypothetical protein NP165_12165 [Vibrio japonicus]
MANIISSWGRQKSITDYNFICLSIQGGQYRFDIIRPVLPP